VSRSRVAPSDARHEPKPHLTEKHSLIVRITLKNRVLLNERG
jgi:hypothetical protein